MATPVCPTGQVVCGDICVDTNNDPSNCGTCGTPCAIPHALAGCSAGVCTVDTCDAGCSNRDNQVGTGCETHTEIDPANCGACGIKCNVPNGTAGCTNGTCTVATCNAGVRNCDNNAATGCEVNTMVDVNNCGACGFKCTVVNGVPGCLNGVCSVLSCNVGYGNCDSIAATGCETNLQNDPNNCGTSGSRCSGLQSCVAGTCKDPV